VRTTITLDDDLAAALKEAAFRSKTSFKAVLNRALRAGLSRGAPARRPKRYRLDPVHLGGVVPGIDLDRALRLADALEDEALARKLELRK